MNRIQRNGREVLDTGRVYIGLLAQPKPQEQGEHAKLFQKLFTTPVPREWHEHPVCFRLKSSLWERIIQRAKTFASHKGRHCG